MGCKGNWHEAAAVGALGEKMKHFGALLVLVALSMPANGQEIVLGRWCDQPFPDAGAADNIVTITVDQTGAARLTRQFHPSSEDHDLTELEPGVFVLSGSVDGMRIEPSGSLQLFDDLGDIRILPPMDAAAQDGDCLRS